MVEGGATRLRGVRPLAWVLMLGAAYAVAYCFWYGATSMGAHPVLDGKENLQLAWAVADASLPGEPFYRAPLYPLIISLGMGLGLPESLWPDFARLINLVAWVVSLWLVARLAMQLWANQRAALAAAGVWALYPVGLFFLGDPLDITLSIALLLGGLDRAAALLRSASPQQALASGFLLALAALTRPQMWTVALAMPFILIVLIYGFRRGGDVEVLQANEQSLKPPPRWPVFFIFLGLALPAILMGAFNQKLSGDFTILPTQGPFNLYSANKPGAHGKYFAQQIEVYQHDQHQNPARVESIYHYLRDRGSDASTDWREINDYWRGRTKEMLADDPVGFAGRLARKGYYLANNYEQYNNKTYSVHKDLSPVLKYNPLGWGVLLVLATPLVFWGRKNPLLLTVLLGAVVAYAGGLLLTYVSARFRLPLAPILAVLVGGWATLPWQSTKGWRLWTGGGGMLLAGVLAFSSWFAVREPPTAIQDYLLLGYAALDDGQDAEAKRWAETALEEDPQRLAARELAVVAAYNLNLDEVIRAGNPKLVSSWRSNFEKAQKLAPYSPRVNYMTGVYAWWAGDRENARSRWASLLEEKGSLAQSALTALIMTGEGGLSSQIKTALARMPEKDRQASLQVALAHRRGQPLSEDGQAVLQQLQAVYPKPGAD